MRKNIEHLMHRGGSIFCVASTSVNTLKDYRFRKVIKAEDGQNGMTKLQDSRSGKDTTLLVPGGTVIMNECSNSYKTVHHQFP